MKPSLALAMAVKGRKGYAKGGMINSDRDETPPSGFHDDLMHPVQDDDADFSSAQLIPGVQGYDEKDEDMPKVKMPRMMLASGGIAQKIMAKRMAKGGMVNQGDNMPVNDDVDMLSAETSTEGPMGEGMDESDREDKIMVRKSMLDRIMSKLHSDNKGA